VVDIAADLPQFLQRRELAAYEQRLARAGYAYGVDLRRAAWLAGSMLGDPLMRSVDRRWTRMVQGLEEDSLLPLRKAPPIAVLEELAGLIQLLRAPLPTLRLLRPELAEPWPMVTPLGTTKGAIHWLVLDLPRVMALPADERTFALASALGRLQCDHGPIFAAHLMAHRGARLGPVTVALRPWAKVSAFSADRAGLLAVRSLDTALRAIERECSESVPWRPPGPTLAQRRLALEEFDRSQLLARRRALSDPDGGGWTLAPQGRHDGSDSLAQRIRAAFGRFTRFGHSEESTDEAAADEAAADEAAAGEAPLDPARASRLSQALYESWTLARCDARLTRRLRLL